MIKPLAALLLLSLPVSAAAQGRRGPQEPDHVSLSSTFSGRGGFDSRTSSLKLAFTPGRIGGYSIGWTLDAAHTRYFAGPAFPGELYDTGLALRASGRKWTFGAAARSNSDHPFNSPAEIDAALDAVTTLSRGGPHHFMLGFSYSSRRSFLRGIPFPYVSYSYNTERLSLFLPFALKWRPTEGGELSVSYFPPRYFTSGYRQKLSGPLSMTLQGGLQMSQYLPAGRPDKERSLFIEQPSAGLKTDITPAKDWTVSIWTAWGFRGRYFVGESYDVHRDGGPIATGPIAGLGLKRAF